MKIKSNMFQLFFPSFFFFVSWSRCERDHPCANIESRCQECEILKGKWWKNLFLFTISVRLLRPDTSSYPLSLSSSFVIRRSSSSSSCESSSLLSQNSFPSTTLHFQLEGLKNPLSLPPEFSALENMSNQWTWSQCRNNLGTFFTLMNSSLPDLLLFPFFFSSLLHPLLSYSFLLSEKSHNFFHCCPRCSVKRECNNLWKKKAIKRKETRIYLNTTHSILFSLSLSWRDTSV